MALSPSASAISSRMTFLKRDALWEVEKPYRLRYVPIGADGSRLPTSNLKVEERDVVVRDMRPHVSSLSLDVNGFEVHALESELEYADFMDYDKVQSVYVREIKELVREACGAKQTHALDYELRKRHETFPMSTGGHYDYAQPALLSHIDVTNSSLEDIVRAVYGPAADEILKSRVQCVTVWKPLRGPVEDWPLALCDARTLDIEHDVVDSDAVYPNFVAENCMVHFNAAQQWFYLSHQDASELLLFKSADSDPALAAPVAHGAFHIPNAGAYPARESIDVRVLVMHADIEYPEALPWST